MKRLALKARRVVNTRSLTLIVLEKRTAQGSASRASSQNAHKTEGAPCMEAPGLAGAVAPRPSAREQFDEHEAEGAQRVGPERDGGAGAGAREGEEQLRSWSRKPLRQGGGRNNFRIDF